MIQTDLHMHSNFSNDGEYTVEMLIERCLINDIGVFSITDHNSVQANKEAEKFSSLKQLQYIPGIEIDCIYKGINLHVLGYNIEWQACAFVDLEKNVTHKVMQSFDQMIENTLALGFRIDKDAVLEYANGILPSAELIAEVMIKNKAYHTKPLERYLEGGDRSDMPYINFYLDYFAQGRQAFVPIDYISFDEAISLIRDNGGTPIVAHPGLNLAGREEIACELLDSGAMGLEVFNNYHTMEQIDYFALLVQQDNKLMTCGSDFHGKTKPLINIGQYKFKNEYEAYLRRSVLELINS